MASRLIVFDLDGTLVDTAPDLVATLNTILARQGLPAVDYEAARNMVGGGALLREKIVAAASLRMVVIADESKWVPALGRFPLPIEVEPFGLESTRRAVAAAFANTGCAAAATLRLGKDGHAFVTDGGHWILDGALQRIVDPKALAARLSAIPGVIEHGLFIGLATAAVLAGSEGVRVIERT